MSITGIRSAFSPPLESRENIHFHLKPSEKNLKRATVEFCMYPLKFEETRD
jgi:hypothetical protein